MPRTSRLPGVQAELLEELLATGTPVVVVVVSGRPYALGEVSDRAAGLVQAFMPGQEGGAAIAGVLSGRIQPSGRLPVQIPRRPGGQPGTYLQPPLGAEHSGTSNLDPTPLFPFGHGRSYTIFAIDDLRLSSAEVPTDGEFTASVRVRNTGSRAGEEVVQLYLHDVVATVARPVRQLDRLRPGCAGRWCCRGRLVPRPRRPDGLHRAGPSAHRRAWGHRRPDRHLGCRPALPRNGTADRSGARSGERPSPGHPGGLSSGGARPEHVGGCGAIRG